MNKRDKIRWKLDPLGEYLADKKARKEATAKTGTKVTRNRPPTPAPTPAQIILAEAKARMNELVIGPQPASPRRRKNQPEAALQKSCLEWLGLKIKTDLMFRGLVCFHPANGGKRNAREAAIFKAMGVRAGVSDLIVCLPPRGRFAAIELKASPSNRATAGQMEFQADVQKAGGLWGCVFNLDQFVELITIWLKEERNRT